MSLNEYALSNERFITTIRACSRVTLQDAFYDSVHDGIVLAIKVEKGNGLYDIDYIFLNANMTLSAAFTECKGVLPNFIPAPDGSVWVRLTSTTTDKIKEVVLPLMQRERVIKDILSSEFPADTTIIDDGDILLHSSDIFDKRKADKLCRLLFDKESLYKTRKSYKIEMPSHCKPILNEEGLHFINLVSRETILHRLGDLEGNIHRSKEFSLKVGFQYLWPLWLSFDGNSVFLITQNNSMKQVVIDQTGCVLEEINLFEDMTCKDYFYNVFAPVILSDHAYLVRFNHEYGSGYAMIKDGKVINCMTTGNKDSCYRGLDGSVLEFNSNDFRLVKVLLVSEDKVALFFGAVSVESDNKEIKILTMER
jgi:hypothetical protein